MTEEQQAIEAYREILRRSARSAKRYTATLTPEVRAAVLTLGLRLMEEARRREADNAQQS